MKKILLISLFFISLSQTKAQQIALSGESEVSVSQSALAWENQKLRSDLTLTDEQFKAIKDITLERYKARKVVAQMFQYEPKKQTAKIQEIESQFDGEFQEILTEKQFKKYLALQEKKEIKAIPVDPNYSEVEPSFNSKIQDLISKATAPVVDPSLLPQQDSVAGKVAVVGDSLVVAPVQNPDILKVSSDSISIKELNAALDGKKAPGSDAGSPVEGANEPEKEKATETIIKTE